MKKADAAELVPKGSVGIWRVIRAKCKRIIDFYHKSFDNIKAPAGIRKKLTALRKTGYLYGTYDS